MSNKTTSQRNSGGATRAWARKDAAACLRLIDERLQTLIGERARIAAECRQGEGSAGIPPFFAYDDLRDLIERHDGSFPVTVVEHVWRELSAAAALAGTQTAVHCEASLEPAALIDTIRYHFGFSISVEEAGDAPDVVRAVAERPGDFGVLQLQERAELPWWRGLGGLAPVIVAKLPFLIAEDRPADLPALVVAAAATASGGDMAAYDARWRGQLPGPLMSCGIEVLAFHRTAEGVDALLGAPAEMSEAEIADLCRHAGAGPEILRRVGSYATPIDIDDMPASEFDGPDE